jgi:hypothetical protein
MFELGVTVICIHRSHEKQTSANSGSLPELIKGTRPLYIRDVTVTHLCLIRMTSQKQNSCLQ